MIKAQLLRQRIEARLPHLESDKLTMFVSKGRILTNAKASGAYEQHYTTEIVLTDYAGEPDTLFGTVVDFMREQMPEVMGNPELAREAISFEAEALNHRAYDLLITVQLSEQVTRYMDASGNEVYTHHPAITDDDEREAMLFLLGPNHPDMQQIIPKP